MYFKKLSVAALAAASLVVSLTSCSADEQTANSSAEVASTTATAAGMSVFGEDRTDILFQIHERNVRTIIATIEERGGTPTQAIAALIVSQAETGWRSGLPLPPPATGIADIYGWRFSYNAGAESTNAVRVATHTFMDKTSAVDVDPNDPVEYALAVQQSDERPYIEDKRFLNAGGTAASKYAAARLLAEAAYAEVRTAR